LNTSAAVSVRETGAAAAAAPDASAGGGGIVTRALRSGPSTTRRGAARAKSEVFRARQTLRCVLYKSFSPIARFQRLIASPFN
jgi:hypothetical protein